MHKLWHVEKQFDYKGYQCVVVMQTTGHRCGYVGVSKEHPLYNKFYEDYLDIKKSDIGDREVSGVFPLFSAVLDDDERVRIDAYFSCHGGITFSDGGVCSDYPIKSDLWWFGFDCGHYNDIPDYQEAKRIFREADDIFQRLSNAEDLEKEHPNTIGQVRSLDFVVSECVKLAEQLSEFELNENECVKEDFSLNDLFACGTEVLQKIKLSGGSNT